MNLTILIEAKHIPEDSTVFKATGTMPYILKDEIKIYTEDVIIPQIIKNDGCKFMISETGFVNVIPETKILKWETDLDTLNFIFGDNDEDK